MSDAPLVSAIIIFLNGEKYLADAIESVLAQTCPDWELLLCDDGSTDGATRIASGYAARFPGKVRYLEHPNHENRGMSATRMLGVRNARGKYVAMLDADDVWVPRKVEEQSAILDAHPEAAMVYGPLKLWYGWTGRPEDARRDFLQDLGVPADAVVPPPAVLLAFLRNEMHHPSGVMVRREVLEAVGGYEAAFRTEYEDVVVQSKVCLEYPVYASRRCWYHYRQHEGSCTAATRRDWDDMRFRRAYLLRLEQYLREKGVTSGPVWDEVRKQLKPLRGRVRYAAWEAGRKSLLAVRAAARRVLPGPAMAWLRAKRWGQPYAPPKGGAA
jgi:glycosyltransferase involved in cell wall biosynthesis